MIANTRLLRPLDYLLHGLLAFGAPLLLSSASVVLAQDNPSSAATQAAATLSLDQLDSLVAPIALYPDDLLAQTLVAATYPLEIIQLQQWLTKNPNLKDKALADAVAKQPWDPSIQSMAAIPDVVKRLADDIQWTTELGNAFLAQQGDVMNAVQRMRRKAADNGALASNEEQKVSTQTIEQKTVIVVESADPQVVYVPAYSPTVVYGAPVYPYPPIYYPTYPPGAAFVTFSLGVMVGAAWNGSCCGMGWGHSDIDIDVDNNFNRTNNFNGDRSGGKWQHNPQHRGGAPYGDRATANRFGGTARGDSLSRRQADARQRTGQVAGSGAGTRSPTATDRGGGRDAGYDDRSSDRAARERSADRRTAERRTDSGFSGGSGGFNGREARASSTRGASSLGGRRGGGGGGRRR